MITIESVRGGFCVLLYIIDGRGTKKKKKKKKDYTAVDSLKTFPVGAGPERLLCKIKLFKVV